MQVSSKFGATSPKCVSTPTRLRTTTAEGSTYDPTAYHHHVAHLGFVISILNPAIPLSRLQLTQALIIVFRNARLAQIFPNRCCRIGYVSRQDAKGVKFRFFFFRSHFSWRLRAFPRKFFLRVLRVLRCELFFTNRLRRSRARAFCPIFQRVAAHPGA